MRTKDETIYEGLRFDIEEDDGNLKFERYDKEYLLYKYNDGVLQEKIGEYNKDIRVLSPRSDYFCDFLCKSLPNVPSIVQRVGSAGINSGRAYYNNDSGFGGFELSLSKLKHGIKLEITFSDENILEHTVPRIVFDNKEEMSVVVDWLLENQYKSDALKELLQCIPELPSLLRCAEDMFSDLDIGGVSVMVSGSFCTDINDRVNPLVGINRYYGYYWTNRKDADALTPVEGKYQVVYLLR